MSTLISAPAQRLARQRCPHGAGHFSGARAELRMRSGHLVAAGVAHAAHIGRHRGAPAGSRCGITGAEGSCAAPEVVAAPLGSSRVERSAESISATSIDM